MTNDSHGTKPSLHIVTIGNGDRPQWVAAFIELMSRAGFLIYEHASADAVSSATGEVMLLDVRDAARAAEERACMNRFADSSYVMSSGPSPETDDREGDWLVPHRICASDSNDRWAWLAQFCLRGLGKAP